MEIENINIIDYPDFVDASAIYAEWDNGESLTDAELDNLNEQNFELIYEYIIDKQLYI